MGQNVKLEVFYPHPPEKVWRILTDRRALAAWLMENDFEPCLGRKFQFHNPLLPGLEIIDCEVIALDAPKRLVYTWQERQMSHPSLVTWTLEPVHGGTQLRLDHRGVPSQASQFPQPAQPTRPWQVYGGPQAVLSTRTPKPAPMRSLLHYGQHYDQGQYGQIDLTILETPLLNIYLDGGWRTALDTRLRSLLTDGNNENGLTRENCQTSDETRVLRRSSASNPAQR